MYLPAGILSPNFEVENRTKPDITKKIEEGDTPMTPEACVECLITGRLPLLASAAHSLISSLKGLERGYYQITNDLITDILRVASRGNAPWNNILFDWILLGIAAVGLVQSLPQ